VRQIFAAIAGDGNGSVPQARALVRTIASNATKARRLTALAK